METKLQYGSCGSTESRPYDNRKPPSHLELISLAVSNQVDVDYTTLIEEVGNIGVVDAVRQVADERLSARSDQKRVTLLFNQSQTARSRLYLCSTRSQNTTKEQTVSE